MKKVKKVHFVGIGGIGVSAVARMMLGEGKEVSGSDRSESEIIKELSKMGARVFFGHNANNLDEDTDLVIYTPAVNENNPELQKARMHGIPALSYPEILGLISKDKYTIAVSGAHGKTTTTAMIGGVLEDAGLDPTIIVGSILKDKKSNFISGKSKYFVVEACEYKKSFLNINPNIIVITNIDNDHLDYYGSIENIQKAFAEFVSKLGEKDYLVCDVSGEHMKEILKVAKCIIINYQDSPSDLRLKIPGRHNLANAKAVYAVAKILAVEDEVIRPALEKFSGTWRRFEYKGETSKGALVYDDYAHHPTEIKATLAAAKETFPDKKIICAFQPHLFSRTKFLMDDFARSFNDADIVLIADIYAAREKNEEGVSAEDLAQKISENGQKAIYLGTMENIKNYLLKNAGNDSVIMTMGAGDIYKIAEGL